MVLEFKFIYTSSNHLLQGFLQGFASDLPFFYQKNQDEAFFAIQGSKDQLDEFCTRLNLLCAFLFLKDSSVCAKEGNLEKTSDFVDFDFVYDNLTPSVAKAYLKDKKLIKNEFGVFLNASLKLNDDFISITKENFNYHLNQTLDLLLAKKCVIYRDLYSTYKLSIYDNQGDFTSLMPTNPSKINKLFSCPNESLVLLASLEKPQLCLKFNAIYKQNHPNTPSHAKISLPSNIFLYACCEELAKRQINFLSFLQISNKNEYFKVCNPSNKLVVLHGVKYLNPSLLKILNSKPNKRFAKISYLLASKQTPSMLCDFSTSCDDIVLLLGEFECVDFSKVLSFYSKQSLENELNKNETSKKLLTNYLAKYPIFDFCFKPKANIYSLFSLAAYVLGFNDAKEIFIKAKACKIPKGVLIDFKLDDGRLNPIRFICSVMSFKLAGCDDLLICLSIIHSLAYFIRDLYDTHRPLKGLNLLIITGDLFTHETLLAQIIKQNKDVFFGELPLSF